MKNEYCLHIYLDPEFNPEKLTFWKKFVSGNFSRNIIKLAKNAGLKQANTLVITSGFIENGEISYNNKLISSSEKRCCIEIIDSGENLSEFLSSNKSILKNCKTALFKLIPEEI